MGVIVAVDSLEAFLRLVEELNGAKVAVDASWPPVNWRLRLLGCATLRFYVVCPGGIVVCFSREFRPRPRDLQDHQRTFAAFKKAYEEARKFLEAKGFVIAGGWVQLSEVGDCGD